MLALLFQCMYAMEQAAVKVDYVELIQTATVPAEIIAYCQTLAATWQELSGVKRKKAHRVAIPKLTSLLDAGETATAPLLLTWYAIASRPCGEVKNSLACIKQKALYASLCPISKELFEAMKGWAKEDSYCGYDCGMRLMAGKYARRSLFSGCARQIKSGRSLYGELRVKKNVSQQCGPFLR